MGVAVSGMHYTGMAAMRVSTGSMSGMGGTSAASFLVPLLVGLTIVTFIVTLVISLAPTEDEIHEDARLRDRIATDSSAAGSARPAQPGPPSQAPQPPSAFSRASLSQGPFSQAPQPQDPQPPASPPLPTRSPSIQAIIGRGRSPRRPAGPRQPE
jgi:hypothetical protein